MQRFVKFLTLSTSVIDMNYQHISEMPACLHSFKQDGIHICHDDHTLMGQMADSFVVMHAGCVLTGRMQSVYLD